MLVRAHICTCTYTHTNTHMHTQAHIHTCANMRACKHGHTIAYTLMLQHRPGLCLHSLMAVCQKSTLWVPACPLGGVLAPGGVLSPAPASAVCALCRGRMTSSAKRAPMIPCVGSGVHACVRVGACMQIRQFQPKLVAIKDASKVAQLKELIKDVPQQPEILVGHACVDQATGQGCGPCGAELNPCCCGNQFQRPSGHLDEGCHSGMLPHGGACWLDGGVLLHGPEPVVCCCKRV